MLLSRPRTFLLSVLFGCYAASQGLAANTLVRLDTPIGSMTFKLYDDAKPVTVVNFLKYIDSGRFKNSFAHRLSQGFVLQGGAFTYNAGPVAIPTYSAIVNEAGPFPEYSNVEGTLVMAKLSGDPDSATSSWFINLKDNNTGIADEGNLDLQNSGFTVFGTIVNGLNILQQFKAFTNYANVDGTNLIVNAGGSPFDNLPVMQMIGGDFLIQDLIYTSWTVLRAPATVIPVLTTRAKVTGRNGKVILKGSASQGTIKVEVKAGKKGFKVVKGSFLSWKFLVKGLKAGKYKFTVRATSTSGNTTVKAVTAQIRS